MKLNGRTRPTLIRLLLLGLVAGTLAWALLEAFLALAGLGLDLTLGPVGIDLYALSFSIRVNPGTFLGLWGGLLLFRSL